jgi:hypothetical protein
MSRVSEVVSGTAVTGVGRPSKRYAEGRVCKEPGCATKLSIYNKGKFCYIHEPIKVPRTRGRKVA